MKKPTLKQRHAILLKACRAFSRGWKAFQDDPEIMYPFDHKGFYRGALAVDGAANNEARDFAPKKRTRVAKFPKH